MTFGRFLFVLVGAALLLNAGCQSSSGPSITDQLAPITIPNAAQRPNQQFLNRKQYDPWILTSAPSDFSVPAYIADGHGACLVDGAGNVLARFAAGHYINNMLLPVSGSMPSSGAATGMVSAQSLNLETGVLRTGAGAQVAFTDPSLKAPDWLHIWSTSDIAINGDAEAQQVVHALMFYLLSSTYPGSNHSIPPMGLSSTTYDGHIFWDADTWMFPALVAQHPDYAKSIVDYRFKTLSQAMKNAKARGLPGAEYAWESAATGAETAPEEFAKERHITADVGLAAWQYYLWTGDKSYLEKEGWPILRAVAAYWAKRATKGADGAYHVLDVLPPDETTGDVDDDSYTNGAVRAVLRAAAAASKIVGSSADPNWATIAGKIVIPTDPKLGFPLEYAPRPGGFSPARPNFQAKQADTLLLLYPLNVPYDDTTKSKMLDYYAAHTMKEGPAMTACIHAVIAARIGKSDAAMSYFHDSYRPFVRGPWDAFSEKRTTNTVYFMTGMAGTLQSVIYGFAGLQIVAPGDPSPPAQAQKLAGDDVAALYAAPHLPAGWTSLTLKGVRFRGKIINLTIGAGNKVSVSAT